MEVALGAQDAMEWSYRGEGAANLVLCYCGRSPQFVGKVLRIQKDRANGSENRTGHSSLTIPESQLWKDVKELVSAPSREIAGHVFTQHVMGPLLGHKHVDAGVRILVSKEFLEEVERNALQLHLKWNCAYVLK